MSIEEAIEAAVKRAVEKALLQMRPATNATDELLSVESAAELADVSKATIRRWIEQGMLKRYGSGRAVRVRREDVLSVRPPEVDPETDVDQLAAQLLSRKG